MAALLPESSGRKQWLPIAIALGLLILVLAVGRRERSYFLAPAGALKDAQMVAGGERQPAATTGHLRVYVSPGAYDAPTASAMTGDLEKALGYVEERTGMHLARPVNVDQRRR